MNEIGEGLHPQDPPLKFDPNRYRILKPDKPLNNLISLSWILDGLENKPQLPLTFKRVQELLATYFKCGIPKDLIGQCNLKDLNWCLIDEPNGESLFFIASDGNNTVHVDKVEDRIDLNDALATLEISNIPQNNYVHIAAVYGGKRKRIIAAEYSLRNYQAERIEVSLASNELPPELRSVLDVPTSVIYSSVNAGIITQRMCEETGHKRVLQVSDKIRPGTMDFLSFVYPRLQEAGFRIKSGPKSHVINRYSGDKNIWSIPIPALLDKVNG